MFGHGCAAEERVVKVEVHTAQKRNYNTVAGTQAG